MITQRFRRFFVKRFSTMLTNRLGGCIFNFSSAIWAVCFRHSTCSFPLNSSPSKMYVGVKVMYKVIGCQLFFHGNFIMKEGHSISNFYICSKRICCFVIFYFTSYFVKSTFVLRFFFYFFGVYV